MKKTRLIVFSVLSALALTSCNLFNDNDITIQNHFNSKEEASAPKPSKYTVDGIGSQEVNLEDKEDGKKAYVLKNLLYSNYEALDEDGRNIKYIVNNHTTAKGFKYDVNDAKNYYLNSKNNNFDLYLPTEVDPAKDQTIVLFIHGGAWVAGLKTHVNPYVKEFAKRGYISATMEYTLLSKDSLTKDEMDSYTFAQTKELSVFRNLDEIQACIYTINQVLDGLEFTGARNIVIGGGSSGSHLTMLYTYSRGQSYGPACPLPIKFIINAVGPTDINENVWKAFNYGEGEEAAYEEALTQGLSYSRIEERKAEGKLRNLNVSGASFEWNEYQTMRIANGMCGFPFTPDQIIATTDEEKVNVTDKESNVYKSMVSDSISGEKLLSVTNYITPSTNIPMVCAYSGKDSIVGIAQFANLQHALETTASYTQSDTFGASHYKCWYFPTAGHTDLDRKDELENYNGFIETIDSWLKAV